MHYPVIDISQTSQVVHCGSKPQGIPFLIIIVPIVVKVSCQLCKYVLYVTLVVSFNNFCPCRHLIEVQRIVSVMAEWLVPQVQKAKNGARLRHGHSAKSFAMLWNFQIPIGVSEHNDTVLYPLQLP